MLLTPLTLLALVLLAAPGPTNALLAAYGAERGVRHSLLVMMLVPLTYGVAIAAWLALITGLVRFGAILLDICQIVAAVFLISCAIRFWAQQRRSVVPQVGSPARLVLTTLLNPKALVFATLLVSRGAGVETIAGLVLVALFTSLGWTMAGEGFRRVAGDRMTPRGLCRVVALSYGAFGLYLAFLGLGAAVSTLS